MTFQTTQWLYVTGCVAIGVFMPLVQPLWAGRLSGIGAVVLWYACCHFMEMI